MMELLALAVAGALGTLARYGVSRWTYAWLGDGFAFGTLAVNVLGCFLLAFLMQLALTGDLVPRTMRLAFGVGFLGAFTTFSTFGFETMRYMDAGAWRLALANVAANLVLGLAATWALICSCSCSVIGLPQGVRVRICSAWTAWVMWLPTAA